MWGLWPNQELEPLTQDAVIHASKGPVSGEVGVWEAAGPAPSRPHCRGETHECDRQPAPDGTFTDKLAGHLPGAGDSFQMNDVGGLLATRAQSSGSIDSVLLPEP